MTVRRTPAVEVVEAKTKRCQYCYEGRIYHPADHRVEQCERCNGTGIETPAVEAVGEPVVNEVAVGPDADYDSPLYEDIRSAINRHSRENVSDTPDFVLAGFLTDALRAFDVGVTRRCHFYGRYDTPGGVVTPISTPTHDSGATVNGTFSTETRGDYATAPVYKCNSKECGGLSLESGLFEGLCACGASVTEVRDVSKDQYRRMCAQADEIGALKGRLAETAGALDTYRALAARRFCEDFQMSDYTSDGFPTERYEGPMATERRTPAEVPTTCPRCGGKGWYMVGDAMTKERDTEHAAVEYWKRRYEGVESVRIKEQEAARGYLSERDEARVKLRDCINTRDVYCEERNEARAEVERLKKTITMHEATQMLAQVGYDSGQRRIAALEAVIDALRESAVRMDDAHVAIYRSLILMANAGLELPAVADDVVVKE